MPQRIVILDGGLYSGWWTFCSFILNLWLHVHFTANGWLKPYQLNMADSTASSYSAQLASHSQRDWTSRIHLTHMTVLESSVGLVTSDNVAYAAYYRNWDSVDGESSATNDEQGKHLHPAIWIHSLKKLHYNHVQDIHKNSYCFIWKLKAINL